MKLNQRDKQTVELKSQLNIRHSWSLRGGGRILIDIVYGLDGWLNVHLSITFLTGAQDSHLQRVTIPEGAHIQLRRGPPDNERG